MKQLHILHDSSLFSGEYVLTDFYWQVRSGFIETL